jgi:hypothetical protein
LTATGALLALGGPYIIGLLPVLAIPIANTLCWEVRLRRWRRDIAR